MFYFVRDGWTSIQHQHPSACCSVFGVMINFDKGNDAGVSIMFAGM